MQMNINIKLVYLVLPFLIHFVFKCELNIATAHFHCVDEKNWDLVLIECLSLHNIID